MFSSVYEENGLKYEYVGSRFAAGQCYRLRIPSESETKICMQASPISSACALAVYFSQHDSVVHTAQRARKRRRCIFAYSNRVREKPEEVVWWEDDEYTYVRIIKKL